MSNLQRVIDLVHRRDALEAERSKLTSDLDRKIAAVNAEIEAMLGASAPKPPLATVFHGPTRRKRGRPRANGAGFANRTLAAIADSPGAPYRDLAVRVYGRADADTLHRLRAVINTLKNQGRIKLIAGAERGRWEAVTQNGAQPMT